jgi:TetR/AcrR family transcriptional regulator, transcriptional repressor for nem operon
LVKPATTTPSGSTREQILQVARELIQTRSYLGFSFQDVADQVGIRKPSLYHHFRSKEALGVEVLREATQRFTEWTQKRGEAPLVALDAYFRLYRQGLRAGSAVCPAGALAPGWDCIDDGLRQAARDLRHAHVLWLTGVLGALAPGRGASAGALAASVFATCQGAMLSARMTGRAQDFDEVVAQLRRSLAGA